MPKILEDLTGKKFNSWMVLGYSYHNKNGNRVWKCQCKCGEIGYLLTYVLKSGRSKQCKRCASSTHGMRNTRIYGVWTGMLDRCYNKKGKDYHNYGLRGIRVYSKWRNSFENFFVDMGNKPKNLSLGRIDNDGNYEPGNCRWETYQQQQNNRRSNHLVTYKGKTQTLKQWSEELGISYTTISDRINKHHWEIEDALTRPQRTYQTMITYKDKTMNISQWAKELNMGRRSLNERINKGWSIEDVFTKSMKKRKA